MPHLNSVLAASAVAMTVMLGPGSAQATYNHAPHGNYAAPMHWLRAAVHGHIDSVFNGDPRHDLQARVWFSAFSLKFNRACAVFGPAEADAVAAMRDAERSALSRFVAVSRFGEADARLFLRRHGCEGGLATGMRQSVQRVGRFALAFGQAESSPIALEFGRPETGPRRRRGEQAEGPQVNPLRSRQSVVRIQAGPRQQPSRGEAITVSRSGGDASGGTGSAGSGGTSGGSSGGPGGNSSGGPGGGASGGPGGNSSGGPGGNSSSGQGGSSNGSASDNSSWSDRRLKTDIVRLATAPSGLGIYAFNYVWGGQTMVGAMADEVALVRPTAVIARENGFLSVDYAQIDVRMMPYTEWLARHE